MIRFPLPVLLAVSVLLPGATAAVENDFDETNVADESYSCFIEPSEVVDIGTPVAGIVAEVLHERADRVAAGEVIVKLESVIEDSNLRLAAAHARFEEEIREQEVYLDFARRKHERARAMHAKKAITLDQLEQTDADVRIAEKQLEKARHNHRIAQLEFERSKRLRDQRNIPSPIDGVVVERLIAPGEFAKDTPLMRVAQLDPLKVEVILPVETLGEIAQGDALAVLAHETGDRHEATVDVVDRVVDSASGTYRVTLKLPNPELAIASGLKCDVEHPALGKVATVAGR